MTQPIGAQPAAASDPVGDVAVAAVKLLLLVLAVLVALPLVVPMLVLALLPPGAVTKTRYWLVPRGWVAAVGAGVVVTSTVLVLEVALAASWLSAHSRAARSGWGAAAAAGWAAVWPWLVVNVALGVLLVPAAFALQRRRVARQVQDRRIPDVVTQERIETARKHAADHTAARRIGVALDARSGQVRQVRRDALHAPHLVEAAPVLGIIATPTVRTVAERLRDRRHVRDWVSADARWLQLPGDAGAVRALLVAESGSGKTVLLSGLIESALHRGWPVVFLDAKGDPADADELLARARAGGHQAVTASRWNLFTGSSAQIVEKLMRLLPAPDGANQHYLDEARAVLAAVQGRSPLTSVQDLAARLAAPDTHVRDAADRDLVSAIVEPRGGLTAAGRVGRALSAALRPLEARLDPTGWSYRDLHAGLTVVSLTPADSAQARLGDLMLLDLRHALAARLATGDKQPLLVVVDEFAQLVGDGTDPGDTAAALFETARSAGAGLVLAAQSTAGISSDDSRRARALASGAALLIGRSKDPEDVVRYAGTVMRMESSGAAAGEELRSARAQHTWVIPPQDVREAWDGAFWIIQGGAIAAFRALPARPATPPPPGEADPDPVPSAGRTEPRLTPALAPPARPTARVPRPTGTRPAATGAAAVEAPVAVAAGPITGLEIMVQHLGDQQWLAVAYPATDELILNDIPNPNTAVFTSAAYPPEAQFGAWSDQWHPDLFTRFNPDHDPLPGSWSAVLTELVDTARHRWRL